MLPSSWKRLDSLKGMKSTWHLILLVPAVLSGLLVAAYYHHPAR